MGALLGDSGDSYPQAASREKPGRISEPEQEGYPLERPTSWDKGLVNNLYQDFND